MTLLRVEETDSGGFTVLNLQMVARDADRVLNAMEDFAGYHRS
jgi:hypothetical protein